MADIQRVSCPQMKKDAEDLDRVLKNIPQTINQLQVSMRNLAVCWDGPAWEAFQTQVNRDIQNMNEVYKILIELQKGLGKGRETYLRTEFSVYAEMELLL